MTSSETGAVDRARFGWVRRASAVAMARGGIRLRLPGRDALADVRMGGAGSSRRSDLLVEALLSRHRGR